MSSAKKIILVAESGSVLQRERILRGLFDSRIELFGAWGIDAEEWADCLEWISVMAGVEEKVDHFVATFWQQEGQTFEEFIALAEQINIPSGSEEIEIIRV